MSQTKASRPCPNGTHKTIVQLRWGDQDLLRHINNVAYFRYFEEARVQLFADLGLSSDSGRYGLLAHMSCDFAKPLLYPGTITVAMKCLRIGRTSLELECWISLLDEPDFAYAKGRSVIVCTDFSGTPLPWAEAEIQALQRCFVA